MKGIIIFGLPSLALLLLSTGVSAQTYHTPRALLGEQFASSDRVTYVEIRPQGGERRGLERRLGHALPRDAYTIFVATTGDRIDGYAIFDEERGQHEMISIGTFFDGDGQVARVEVMAYREPFGDGIRANRFRAQFLGRDAGSGFRHGHDIDSISGSTLSARSMCTAVKRASVLIGSLMPRARQLLARQ